MNLIDLVDRARTLATSAIAWLSLALLVLQQVVAEVANAEIQNDATEAIVSWGGRGVVFLVLVIAQVRRVTPVESADRGLL